MHACMHAWIDWHMDDQRVIIISYDEREWIMEIQLIHLMLPHLTTKNACWK